MSGLAFCDELKDGSRYWRLKRRAETLVRAGDSVSEALTAYAACRRYFEDGPSMADPKSMKLITAELAKVVGNMSMLALRQGGASKAVRLAEMAMSTCPSWPKVDVRLGMARAELGDHRGAARAFTAAYEKGREQSWPRHKEWAGAAEAQRQLADAADATQARHREYDRARDVAVALGLTSATTTTDKATFVRKWDDKTNREVARRSAGEFWG